MLHPRRPRSPQNRAVRILAAYALTFAVLTPFPALSIERLGVGVPNSVALSEGDLFWAQATEEFCDPGGAIGRSDSLDVTPSGIDPCAFGPRDLVADDTFLFYREGEAILRAWRGTERVGRPQVWASPDGFLDMAVADDRLYWADDRGILFVSTTQPGEPVLLEADTTVARGSLDVGSPGAIVWTTTDGRLKAHGTDPAGSAVVLESGLDAPTRPVRDPYTFFTYFVEAGGKITVATGGPVITLFDPAVDGVPGSLITDLAVDEDYVYWMENLPGADDLIRRMPKLGLGNTIIVTGIGGGTNIALDEDNVYWGAFSGPGGAFRERKDAVAPEIDVSVLAVEITQAIQNLANEVPLYAGTPTVVRAFGRSSVPLAGVGAELRGVRIHDDGTRQDLGSVRPSQYTLTLFDFPVVNRNGNPFTFDLPEAWTQGTVELTVELNVPRRFVESDLLNNAASLTRTFVPIRNLCVDVYPMLVEPGLVLLPGEGPYWDIVERAESLLPNPRMEVFPHSTILHEHGGLRGDDEFEIPSDKSKMLRKLRRKKWFRRDSGSNCAANHVIGLVHQDAEAALAGYSFVVVNVGWVRMVRGERRPQSEPKGGHIFVHELGHQYNGPKRRNTRWGHLDCPAGTGEYFGYPYDACSIGPDDAPESFWGFDLLSRRAVRPTEGPFPVILGAADYMAVADDQWVSDHNWIASAERVGVSAAQAGAGAALAEGDVLLVSGWAAPDRDVGSLDPTFRVPVEWLDAESVAEVADQRPDLELQLLDADDGVLAVHPLELAGEVGQGAGAEEPSTDFVAVVPDPPGLAEIRVLRGEVVLAARPATRNAPQVTVLSPQPGDVVTDRLVAEWTGADADGDAITYVVSYSHDGGDTWTTLEGDLPDEDPTTRIDFEAPFLPGSTSTEAPGSSLLRIVATDGLHTTAAVAGPFVVTGRAPVARISLPRDGETRHHLAEWLLRGRGVDPEREPLAFRWRLDGEEIATTETARLSGLPPGPHVLELCVRDPGGLEGCDSVGIGSAAGAPSTDPDGDGVDPEDDNCPEIANASQEDGEGDGVGDACDVCPDAFDADQGDADRDGIGDACDPCPDAYENDPDGDGVCNDVDVCAEVADPDQDDLDGDGFGDACDVCADVFDPLQTDCDEDGVGDACVIAAGLGSDCNLNEQLDSCDIDAGTSSDVNADGLPDECTIPVAIDVRSPIHPMSKGVIRVVIFSDEVFDVGDLDLASVGFGPWEAPPAHDLGSPSELAEHVEDVDEDGRDDLVLHFRTQETGIAPGDDTACISGDTLLGPSIGGCAGIRTVPPACGLGFELALLLPLWRACRRRQGR